MTTPDPRELTATQLAVLRFIYSYFRENHSVPSFREIMTKFDFRSTNAVTCHFKPLTKKGWIEFTYDKEGDEPAKSRGYKLPALSRAIKDGVDTVLDGISAAILPH